VISLSHTNLIKEEEGRLSSQPMLLKHSEGGEGKGERKITREREGEGKETK
jgi:hypothetical protein